MVSVDLVTAGLHLKFLEAVFSCRGSYNSQSNTLMFGDIASGLAVCSVLCSLLVGLARP